MKKLLTILLSLATTVSFAQESATWIGGSFGNATSWHEARNWSTGAIPNEDTHVIIVHTNSGHNSQPIISENAEAASIQILSSATLTISKEGDLIVDGVATYSEGISLYGGKIINNGQVALYNLAVEVSDEMADMITGNGRLSMANDNLITVQK
jgi:hypothetical protein